MSFVLTDYLPSPEVTNTVSVSANFTGATTQLAPAASLGAASPGSNWKAHTMSTPQAEAVLRENPQDEQLIPTSMLTNPTVSSPKLVKGKDQAQGTLNCPHGGPGGSRGKPFVKEGSGVGLPSIQPPDEEEAKTESGSGHSEKNGDSDEEQGTEKAGEVEVQKKNSAKRKHCDTAKKVRQPVHLRHSAASNTRSAKLAVQENGKSPPSGGGKKKQEPAKHHGGKKRG